MTNFQDPFGLEEGIHTDFQEDIRMQAAFSLIKFCQASGDCPIHHDEMLFIIYSPNKRTLDEAHVTLNEKLRFNAR
ncbi:hypothetical protein A5N86_14995 [Geobacillus thermoleovorans]|jgi:hypothetical protein|uniref:Tryptophan 2,3-dioxygenase n=1 Tax=Geobacillus proteiniphilus TaxID=860353 RepID=A0A1Q5SLR3_9BACL|nr:hypothetical protein IB49_08760 [Geobacillus sp. LC300]ASS87193.1 hypothetical protein GLN3_08885 [Geobacillus lituanicus]ASS98042.1 hypothetical protein GT3921_02615 [Geobacillus thermocatenulatus]KFL16057.1 hypothetical protein ET31_08670 [Geobacillus stearothermophilus]KLR74553.1 hypothetical protein ABH20_05085 [Geobacillus sp. T6]ODA15987.1 hypothetical protein A5N86_14995 [Geobacillus thermoleovorans]OKO88964.1 Tryptophan 2,3-dioxygenase [Geobacillus proteiniphilus]GAJ57301.1 hypoth